MLALLAVLLFMTRKKLANKDGSVRKKRKKEKVVGWGGVCNAHTRSDSTRFLAIHNCQNLSSVTALNLAYKTTND